MIDHKALNEQQVICSFLVCQNFNEFLTIINQYIKVPIKALMQLKFPNLSSWQSTQQSLQYTRSFKYVFNIHKVQRKKLLGNTLKNKKWPEPGNKLTQKYMAKSIYLSMQTAVITQERNRLFLKTYFVFLQKLKSKSQFTVTALRLQQSGHTQGGPLSATSNCFPGETTQEVKLLQETLNRAPLLEAQTQSYNGPHSYGEFTG